MNITKIISKVFDSRLKAIDLYDTQAGEIQHRVLTRLVKRAENTEWGKKYDYKSIRNYEDFKNRLPIQTQAWYTYSDESYPNPYTYHQS